MARWLETQVTLSAGQAAGTTPVLAAVPGVAGVNDRKLVAFASRSAAATDLFLTTGGAAGNGIPLAAGGRIDFHQLPGFDGELYIVGATAGEKVVIWTA